MPETPPPLTPLEKRLIYHLSGDLGISLRPWAELGRKVGLTEAEVLSMVEGFQARGLIRRLGATLRHQQSGYRANAMLVWAVEKDRLEECGRLMSERPYVSHCYQRRTSPEWPYNFYAMVHALDEQELAGQIQELNVLAGLDQGLVLHSLREWKKNSLLYFAEDEDEKIPEAL